MLVQRYWEDSFKPGESEWFDLRPDEFHLAEAKTQYDIATLVKDVSPPPSRDKQHAVYTLALHPPTANEKRLFKTALSEGMTPQQGNRGKMIHQACTSAVTLYVGQSNDVVKRLQAHLNGNGVFITKLLRISRLVDIEWFEDEESARIAERETAEQIRGLNEQVYVAGGR